MGSTFVRWGRMSCPNNTELVYSGKCRIKERIKKTYKLYVNTNVYRDNVVDFVDFFCPDIFLQRVH